MFLNFVFQIITTDLYDEVIDKVINQKFRNNVSPLRINTEKLFRPAKKRKLSRGKLNFNLPTKTKKKTH